MSMDAILEAAAATLRTGLTALSAAAVAAAGSGTAITFTQDYVDVQPEGRPPARMGQIYVALDEGSIQSTDRTCLKEAYNIDVILTVKTSVYAPDRRSAIYADSNGKLGALERWTVATIHAKQSVRQAANALLAAGTDGFEMPLYYLGRPKTRFENGTWAGMKPDAAAFMVRTLNFGGALRLQNLASIT